MRWTIDEKIQSALATDRLIDIATIGRNSGKPHRIEITFHRMDSHLYISGSPGKGDWYANLLANPKFDFHLKQSAHADLSARAQPITEESAKREILRPIVNKWDRVDKLEVFVARSPLVEIFLDGEMETDQDDPGQESWRALILQGLAAIGADQSPCFAHKPTVVTGDRLPITQRAATCDAPGIADRIGIPAVEAGHAPPDRRPCASQ